MAVVGGGKRARTRGRIADVATDLFLARGFDGVTVTEVAAAAGVSPMTVFNHFPRKEDLLLDRQPEAADLVTTALRDKPAGTTPVQALRALAHDLAAQRHVLSGLSEQAVPFLRTVQDSPTLLARARELLAELEHDLAEALQRAGTPGEVAPVLAAMVVGAYRSLYTRTAEQVLAGGAPADEVEPHGQRLRRAFDALEAAERAGLG